MKRKHKRYLKNLCFWISCFLLLFVIVDTFLTHHSDVQSRVQFMQTNDVKTNDVVTENTGLVKKDYHLVDGNNSAESKKSMREFSLTPAHPAPSKNTKVRLLNNWKVQTPPVHSSNSAEETWQSDDVILRLGRPRSKLGFLTIGLCTVPRAGAFYLPETLGTLLGSMNNIEKKQVVIVIFLASYAKEWLNKTIGYLENTFHDEINEGLILVVQPKQHIYPDFSKITKRTFNDSLSRVQWRTKQNIDYAYLLSYSRNFSEFYIQLEDDVVAANNFILNIKDYINKMGGKQWFCIEFSSLGFIGKLFHSESLQLISDFLLMFKTEQPCDLLLNYLKRIMTQKRDIRTKKALFQHRGVVSSLENKIQMLTDSRFRDEMNKGKRNFKKRKIHNPTALITTNLSQYRLFSPDKAYFYSATDYFWCKSPSRGSYYNIEFEKPVNLTHIYVQTGHPTKGTDKLENGKVLLGLEDEDNKCGKLVTIAKFVYGKVDINTEKSFFPPDINCVTILVTEDQRDWLIITEIGLY